VRVNLVTSCLWCLAFAFTTGVAAERVPAFPGAEGYGAWATGGRGGRIIAVTTLADSGPGSLREAIEESKEPRIIVFRVAGLIELTKRIRLGDGNVTVAGQTAPGGGICLKGHGLVLAGARNVIIRHLRIRPGDGAGEELDALSGEDCENVIIDHCSVSWATDETLSLYRNKNTTVQWCIISESLYRSAHQKGAHGYGGIWGGERSSWHHNLLAHHSSRNPRFARDEAPIDYRNNVIYNWGFNSAYGGEGCSVNIVANCYVPGPATGKPDRILEASGQGGRWFIEDNRVVGFPGLDRDNWQGGVQAPWTGESGLRLTKSLPAAYLTTETADQAHDSVLDGAGATLPTRDSHDTRIVTEVGARSARFGKSYGVGGNGIIDTPADVGGWPLLASGTALPDKDGDGMPDVWESGHGLKADNPSDGPADDDEDGYTNVEEFLNGTLPRQAVDSTIPKELPVQTVKPDQPAKFWTTEMVVSPSGKGHFKDLREALAAAPAFSRSVFPISIEAGTYPGPIFIPEDKPLLRLIAKGEVIVTAPTAEPALQVAGGAFTAEGIIFQGAAKSPGVIVAGDRAVFRKCRILGEGDALAVTAGRTYLRECTLAGRDTLVSGAGLAFFDRCELRALGKTRIASLTRGKGKGFGAIFSDCEITGDPSVTVVTLGDSPTGEPEALYLETTLPPFVEEAWRSASTGKSAKDFGKAASSEVFLGGGDGWDPSAVPVPLAMLAFGTPPAATGIEALGGNGHVSLSWTPVENVVSYSVKREKAAGGGYDKLAVGVLGAGWIDRDAAQGEARRYLIVSHGPSGKTAESVPVLVETVPPSLAAPWALATSGAKPESGQAQFGNGTLTMKCPPGGTWFAWQALTGSAELVVHLKRQAPGKGKGWAGIRVQRSTDPESPYVLLGVTENGKATMRWQVSGDQADAREGGEIPVPCWLKLTRSREVYSGAISRDGVTWTTIGETSIVPLAGPVHAGLALSPSAAGEAEFDGIAFPLPPPALAEK